jgi:hypothetical protein
LLLSITEMRKRLALVTGQAPDRVTVWRWTTRGFKAPSGQFVRLRSVKVSRRLFIPSDALEAFARELVAGLVSEKETSGI